MPDVSKSFQATTLSVKSKPNMIFPLTKVDTDNVLNEVDGAKLKEELRSCQHFFVDSQPERARHKVFNYATQRNKSEQNLIVSSTT